MWSKLQQFRKSLAPAAPVAAVAPGQDQLDQRFFMATLLAAVVVHMMGLYVWYLVPSMQVVDIPVRSLSIKLGDGEPMTAADIEASQAGADNNHGVEDAISQAVSAEDATASKSAISSMERALTAESDAVDKAMDKALAGMGNDMLTVESRKLAMAAKQFVRTNNQRAPGSARGDSTAKDAELTVRYSQLVSDWIKKFQKYPMEAREKGLEGEGVVRIRIDRRGNIIYRILDRSTGSPILDKAAIEMVTRANPVPAVPNDYPHDDLIEFLIPVNFKLQ